MRRQVDAHRSLKMERAILGGVALFSYVLYELQNKATKNHEILKKTVVMHSQVFDALRGLYGAQREMSPVGAALLARAIFETRCNLRFIYESEKPAFWADRFSRFGGIERLLHEQHRPGGSTISEAERAKTLQRSPEWLKPNGKLMTHWTAEPEIKNLNTLAQGVKLEDKYHRLYMLGSKYMHGSPLLAGVYSGGGDNGLLAGLHMCTRLSLLAVGHASKLLQLVVEFFGFPSIEDEVGNWDPFLPECRT